MVHIYYHINILLQNRYSNIYIYITKIINTIITFYFLKSKKNKNKNKKEKSENKYYYIQQI